MRRRNNKVECTKRAKELFPIISNIESAYFYGPQDNNSLLVYVTEEPKDLQISNPHSIYTLFEEDKEIHVVEILGVNDNTLLNEWIQSNQ